MYSFYGGRPGNSFVIVKAFSSIEEMITNFAQGPNYTEVHYDEHVIINTENKNNQHNGEIYRRGYDYANAMGGAVYIGTIVGPAGKAPMLSLTTQEDIEDMKTQDGQDYTHMYNSGSFSIDQGLVPGKEENSTFNDEITWASYCIKDENSSDSTAYIGFTIPYTVFDWSVESVESYEPIQIIRTKKIDTSDEVDHPFYENLTLKIPKGVKGNSFTNLRIGDGSAADGGASYEGALLCDQYDYSTNPATKTIKNLGSPNMISNIEMNEDNEIIVTWKIAGSEVTNLGAINQIKQITVDDNNNLLVIYSDSSKMPDPSDSDNIEYLNKNWKKVGTIKTISGTKVFYQDSEPSNESEKINDLLLDKENNNESQLLKICTSINGNSSSWDLIKLNKNSIKSIEPNQIESGTATAIINWKENNDKIIEVSPSDGLFAKKGTIGGWTIGENKISTSFQETSNIYGITRTGTATIEIDSQKGFLLQSNVNPRSITISPQLIQIKKEESNQGYISFPYCNFDSNSIVFGRSGDIINDNFTYYSTVFNNEGMSLYNISEGKRTHLHQDGLSFSDEINNKSLYINSVDQNISFINNNYPALKDGIVYWKQIGNQRTIANCINVTVYHCGNLFWAHFTGTINSDWVSSPNNNSILNLFIPIVEGDNSLSSSYAPSFQINKYASPYNSKHPKISYHVNADGTLGVFRTITPVIQPGNDEQFLNYYLQDCDIFWACQITGPNN